MVKELRQRRGIVHLVTRQFLPAVSFAIVASAGAQFGPPFRMGQGHPDLEVPILPELTVDLVLGLEFIEVQGPNSLMWKGYYADGLLCLTEGPPVRVGTADWVEYNWPSNPGFQKFSNPADPPALSQVPPHNGQTCKWIAAWSNNLNYNPTRDFSFTVNVTLHLDPPIEGVAERHYAVPVQVRIVGGPLSIDIDSRADPLAFKLHRANVPAADGDDAGFQNLPDQAYPWYATDFDFNPFDYRDRPNYRLDHLQRVNRFKSRPFWAQPAGTKVEHVVTGPGTFLNPDSELATLAGGAVNPLKTAQIPATAYALISMDGDVDSSTDFQTSATYWCYVGGVPILVADDESSSYYAFADERDGTPWKRGGDYAKFRTHKPKELLDRSHLLTEWSPPFGVGLRVVYLLVDQIGDGMPGTYVQERFVGEVEGFGQALLPDFRINRHRSKWITQRAGYAPTWLSGPEATDGIMGEAPDTIYDEAQDPPLTYIHEYWAATDKEAFELDEYPWRTVPGTVPPLKRYLGVFLGSYYMVFGPSYVTHAPGPRHSPEGPGS